MKRPAFYAGSRYGRSNGQSNSLRITPRRDFHFLRYGKRANDREDIQPIQCYEPIRDYVLTCSFTGVRDFYRCWKGYASHHFSFPFYFDCYFSYLIDLTMKVYQCIEAHRHTATQTLPHIHNQWLERLNMAQPLRSSQLMQLTFKQNSYENQIIEA